MFVLALPSTNSDTVKKERTEKKNENDLFKMSYRPCNSIMDSLFRIDVFFIVMDRTTNGLLWHFIM